MNTPSTEQIDTDKQDRHTWNVALAALDPSVKVSIQQLRQSGLSTWVAQRLFEVFRPEIKNLTGWMRLDEYCYNASWRGATSNEMTRARRVSQEWKAKLEEHNLSATQAVLLFDGELMTAPAPDYRLFILEDERLLWYQGGHFAHTQRMAVGDIAEVLAALEEHNPQPQFGVNQPLYILLQALRHRIEAINHYQERELAERKALYEKFDATIKMFET